MVYIIIFYFAALTDFQAYVQFLIFYIPRFFAQLLLAIILWTKKAGKKRKRKTAVYCTNFHASNKLLLHKRLLAFLFYFICTCVKNFETLAINGLKQSLACLKCIRLSLLLLLLAELSYPYTTLLLFLFATTNNTT